MPERRNKIIGKCSECLQSDSLTLGKDGKLYCEICRKRNRTNDEAKWEECCRCHNKRYVSKRTKEGPVCRSCAQKDIRERKKQV